MEIGIGYMPVNRGRNLQETLDASLAFMENHPAFILILDESDATDREKGLDGREIFSLLVQENIQHYVAKDLHIGSNFITSEDFEIKDPRHVQINKLSLLLSQGRSEKYMHHRLSARLKFKEQLKHEYGFDGIYLITQHNSAFLRPFTRALQSIRGMIFQSKVQKKYPTYLALLVRDQNTLIPGEGKFEKFLRFIFNLNCITDRIDWNYQIQNLEGDSGGLNQFAVWFRDIGGFKFLRRITKIADKIESMCIKNGKDVELGIKITPKHRQIPKSDHGILSINIEKN